MPTYQAIFTTLGLQRLAEAQANYTPLVFTDLAVGDGGGSPTTPDVDQTELVNETARVSVNLIEVDPDNPNQVRVEGLIPAATGGFTIREAGLFNGDNELIAVANYPDIYKPELSDGVSIEEYIRILLVYENPTDAIELTSDLSVVMATRAYVDEKVLHRDFDETAFRIYDDFTSLNANNTIGADIWTKSSAGTETIVDDTAAGAIGAVDFTVNGTGAALNLHYLAVLGLDFYAAARIRVPTKGAATLNYGLDSATAAHDCFFTFDNGSANWKYKVDGSTTTTSVAVSTSYQWLVIKRVNGVIHFLIDDVEVYSGAHSTSITNAGYIHSFSSGGAANLIIDVTKLWIGR